jgi:uncharacterized protein Usg
MVGAPGTSTHDLQPEARVHRLFHPGDIYIYIWERIADLRCTFPLLLDFLEVSEESIYGADMGLHNVSTLGNSAWLIARRASGFQRRVLEGSATVALWDYH